jgi:signal transduction histidine kinase
MSNKLRKLRYVFFIYWFLLAYILTALIWWFIALNSLNHQMTGMKIRELGQSAYVNSSQLNEIKQDEKRKTAQYLGEGSIFFLLIIAGAVFVYRAVRRQLKQSQEQQHFLMALTHELKTPIAVAMLNLETLQRRKLDESQQARLIFTTLQETNRLNALCNNMLLSWQIEAGGYTLTMEETNMSELIANCVHDFVTRFPDRQINAEIDEDIFVNGDRLLLQMAANNLIDNAIKYSPKVSAISISLHEENEKLQLVVADEGKGIDAEEKDKVFDKFYRTGNTATRAAKGTGLGLYLTKKIVKQHSGNISVTDHFPSGAIFTVELKALTEKN